MEKFLDQEVEEGTRTKETRKPLFLKNVKRFGN